MKVYLKRIIITSVITVLPMLMGILLWNKMPDTIATHWGSGNEANGWSSKPFAVFGMPLILTLLHLICVGITLNDPKKKNISQKMLSLIFWIIPVVSWLVCAIMYGTAAGMKVNIGMVTNIIIGILFMVVGNYIPKSKQSYTVGIKLPWTLASTENWNKTSRLAGKLWIVGGILFIINAFLLYSGVLFIVILLMAVIPAVYSFCRYKKGT